MKPLYIGIIILAVIVLLWLMSRDTITSVDLPPGAINGIPVVIPTEEGYIFAQGLDSTGHNIQPPSPIKNKTIDYIKEICSRTAGCVGFNDNGWLKKCLTPKNTWRHWTNDPNKGFYYKPSGLNPGQLCK